MTVLERFKSFTIRKQGEQDYACGLYCVVTAATYLGALDDDGNSVARVLAQVDTNISNYLWTSGVSEKGVRKLAVAAKLGVWRPKKVTLENLASNEGEHIWMALVRMEFDDPKHVVERYDDLHYVLVLEVTDTHVVVADPHPWHEDISVMQVSTFGAIWREARGQGKPPWAGCLYRLSKQRGEPGA
jgi:predicted double-glycine peptidase